MLKKRKKLKVVKAKGGKDMGASAGAPGPGDTGGAGGFDKSTSQFGSKGNSSINTGGKQTTTKPLYGYAGFKQALADRNINLPPLGKVGLAVEVMNAIEKERRKKRAKGEFVLSKKKVNPVNRDFYKTVGRPLDPTVRGPDEAYFKATGITGGPKGTFDSDGPGPIILAKKVAPTNTIPIPLKKVKPRKFDFKLKRGGLSGGVKSGPPPKRGPNPQGMKKGGMACPHRPDGIRGQGAAIKGFKFTGVK